MGSSTLALRYVDDPLTILPTVVYFDYLERCRRVKRSSSTDIFDHRTARPLRPDMLSLSVGQASGIIAFVVLAGMHKAELRRLLVGCKRG